jgi:hypothetical protein
VLHKNPRHHGGGHRRSTPGKLGSRRRSDSFGPGKEKGKIKNSPWPDKPWQHP